MGTDHVIIAHGKSEVLLFWGLFTRFDIDANIFSLYKGPIYRAGDKLVTAELLGIDLVLLPPYSPQFNPIESIWKTIEARISNMFLLHRDYLVATVQEIFETESKKSNYLSARKGTFL